MDSTRRSILRALAAGSLTPAIVSARGLEAWRGQAEQQPRRQGAFSYSPPPSRIRAFS